MEAIFTWTATLLLGFLFSIWTRRGAFNTTLKISMLTLTVMGSLVLYDNNGYMVGELIK